MRNNLNTAHIVEPAPKPENGPTFHHHILPSNQPNYMVKPPMESQRSREEIYVIICGEMQCDEAGNRGKQLGSCSATVTVTVAIRTFVILCGCTLGKCLRLGNLLMVGTKFLIVTRDLHRHCT